MNKMLKPIYLCVFMGSPVLAMSDARLLMSTTGFASSVAGSYYVMRALKTQMQMHEIWNSKEHLDARERVQRSLFCGAVLKLSGLALLMPKIAQSKNPTYTLFALESVAGFTAFSVLCFQEAYK